jgi:hypothetical protein
MHNPYDDDKTQFSKTWTAKYVTFLNKTLQIHNKSYIFTRKLNTVMESFHHSIQNKMYAARRNEFFIYSSYTYTPHCKR